MPTFEVNGESGGASRKRGHGTGSPPVLTDHRLAVDAYVWLHKGAFGCAEELVKGKKTTK